MTLLDFSDALKYLKQGKKVRRKIWIEDMFIELYSGVFVLHRGETVLQWDYQFNAYMAYQNDWEVLE